MEKEKEVVLAGEEPEGPGGAGREARENKSGKKRAIFAQQGCWVLPHKACPKRDSL